MEEPTVLAPMHLANTRAALIACLVLSAGTAMAQQAAPEETITFRNGDIELSGSVMIPKTAGPHPAVVFLHGSGPSTRDGARLYAEEFAKMGVASLFFDKRGCGKSGGSWLEASLDDLAGDGLAAINYLKARKEVDPKSIGFWGVSQAGWVATRAAGQSSDVAFMMIISGGGVSPKESEMYAYEQSFDQAGLSQSDRSEAKSVLDEYFKWLATGVGRDELVKKVEASKNAKWYESAPLDRILPSDDNRKNWSWVATYDPMPDMKRISVPVLLMFGDKDTDHPPHARH